MKKQDTNIHPSGLNIIVNSDGSFAFEWDPQDKRWSWLNGLTDDQIKSIIEESVQKQELLESIVDEYQRQSMGSDE